MMEMQKKISGLGGTMRLGAYPCKLEKDSKVSEDLSRHENISERHRHRYEFNNEYLDAYQKAGMLPVGINEKDNLVEIIELKGHPWFIGVQFHPEFKSTVANPHPLFKALLKLPSIMVHDKRKAKENQPDALDPADVCSYYLFQYLCTPKPCPVTSGFSQLTKSSTIHE